MDAESLRALKDNIDGFVRITVADGEVLVAKVLFVSDEHEDVIYDLVSTDRPQKYEKHDVQPAYSLEFRDILSATPTATLDGT